MFPIVMSRPGGVRRAAIGAVAGLVLLVASGGPAWSHPGGGGGGESFAHRLSDAGLPVLLAVAAGIYLLLAALDRAALRMKHDREGSEAAARRG